jgi:hypothetical protein
MIKSGDFSLILPMAAAAGGVKLGLLLLYVKQLPSLQFIIKAMLIWLLKGRAP